jgi:PAS domain S-box-containing protein
MQAPKHNYRDMIEHMIDGVLVADYQTRRFRLANDAICRMTGYTAEELCRLSVDQLHPPDSLPETLAGFERISTGIERSHTDVPVLRKDGSVFYADINAAPIVYGNETLLMGVFRDTSDRHRVEEELAKKNEEFGHYFDLSLDLLCIADTDGHFRRLNPEWERTLGYSLQDLIGRKFLDFVHPDDLPATLSAISQLSDQVTVLDFENRYRHKDGSWRWLEWRSAPAGNLIYAVARDITERKRAELSNLESNLRFEAAFRASPIPLTIVRTTDRQFVDVNPAACKTFGWDREEVIGKTAQDLRLWGEPAARDAILAELQRFGSVDNRDASLRTKEGKTVQASVSVRPIVLQGVPHVMFLTVDISERRQAEENMIKAQKLESIGLLAGGIAHDFNNLLAGIFGQVELALDDMAENRTREAAESLSKSMAAIGRARDLTRQLLTFAKGGAPVKTMGDIAKTVRETVHFALSGSNIKAEFAVGEGIGGCSYDPHQIGQVIDNMVINAKQAMPEGGEVHVGVDNVTIDSESPTRLPPATYVRITLRDRGSGILPEHLPKVFDPFFSTKQTGSGLGLATSWSIVKRHDGHIDVESTPGEGTTFRIYLPASSGALHSRDASSATLAKGSGRVLVMDDERYVREMAARLLTSLGYTVDVARDGQEALLRIARARQDGNPFCAALLDLTIPGGLGGKEIVTKLAEVDQDLRAIASSGYADDPVMADPSRHGFRASLGKPYSRQEAAEALRRALADGDDLPKRTS